MSGTTGSPDGDGPLDHSLLPRGIQRNSARCLNCRTEVESRSRHEMVFCPCRRLAVDGGSDYLRRVFSGDGGPGWVDTSECVHRSMCSGNGRCGLCNAVTADACGPGCAFVHEVTAGRHDPALNRDV